MAHKLGIIGAGNMAEAIVRGVVSAGVFQAKDIIAADVSPQRREVFSNLGADVTADNAQAVRDVQILLLSVKPQQMAAALAGIGTFLSPTALVISIAAGISSGFIERNLGGQTNWRVVRAMPNTPMLVGRGMSGLSAGTHATPGDLARAAAIFASAGKVVEVRPDQMDAVTAMSGSGPAYFFFLVEQMVAAGERMGFSAEQARLLAVQTAQGAAAMLSATDDPPQELRRKVTSPGGTTQAAITHMEANGVGPAVIEAIEAAERRGKELGL